MANRTLAIVATALLAAVPALSAAPAASPPCAVNYALDSPRSALKFSFKQAGAKNQGRFRKFAVTLRFADTDLGASKLEVGIDINSLDTGDEERDQTLRGAELFDVAKFPQAHFTAAKFSRVSAGVYEMTGKLTIRNLTHDLRIPFTFRTTDEKSGPAAYLTGHTTLNRLDFGVGQGEWQATDQVANEVEVTFGLRFTPAAPIKAAPVK